MAEVKSGSTAGKRKAGGRPFQKGKSGNPAGRPAGVPNKATQEVRETARQLVESPEYRQSLKDRIKDGSLPPAVETMLWHYAYGKPKEQVEVTGAEGAPLLFEMVLDKPEPLDA